MIVHHIVKKNDTLKYLREKDGAGHFLVLKISGYISLGLVNISLYIFISFTNKRLTYIKKGSKL